MLPEEIGSPGLPTLAPVPQSDEVVAYRFGRYRLCLDGRILERDGELVRITPKVADTLLVLLENAGNVVSKDHLMSAVWPDVSVVESGLTRNISMLRQAIEGPSDEGRYIETVPRRGYRFVGVVETERFERFLKEPACTEATSADLHSASSPKRFNRLPVRERVSWLVGIAIMLGCVGLGTGMLQRDAARVASSGSRSNARIADVHIGRHLLAKLTPAETARAQEYFGRAVLADPNSADAHAGLATSLVQLTGLGGIAPHLALPKARLHVERALALDPDGAMSNAAAGGLLLFERNNLAEAERHFEKALERDPKSVSIRSCYSYLKFAMGDVDGALVLLEEALRLDPASPRIGVQYGVAFYYQRDFRRAAKEFLKVLDREPGYAMAHYYLGLSLGFLGEYAEAHEQLQAAKLNPGMLETDRAWLNALAGDKSPARELYRERARMIEAGDLDPSANLLLAVTLGYTDEAIRAVESAVASRASELTSLHAEPRLAALRATQVYANLKAHAGL